jgi:putative FmdB family regulatory protein
LKILSTALIFQGRVLFQRSIFTPDIETTMPTYSYLCSACGHKLDVVQRMSEDSLKDCPKCGQPELARQISAVGFALKGTGWYVTDFRDKGKTAAKSDDSSSAPSESSTTETAKTPSTASEPAKPAETKSSDSSGAAA